ncbi:carbohydrate kinase [Cyanobium sp. Alchichica 3B3-8F6]|uniref:carbohydrate kinase family protein n=1 Tax=Cyanobium sp. Alchichica 3B3-8F6 TaxID=2823696 RepID=UPI0020CB8697|nr:carbohydrate kinase [Cyanobium sp. Alchichica 3B3-8F6]MCP9881697.1 carbohydrate kinase [Cyanobium sp. Alchichica 3B3-8F6]
MPLPQPPAAPLVLCLGEALVDRLAPPDGDRLGGAPANVACALARLGTPSAFLGRLGRDAIGEAFRELFAARGVNTSALQWDAQRPSRVVLVLRDAGGDRQFGGFAGAVGGAGEGGGEGAAGFADQALDAAELSAALGPLLATARWLLVGTIPLASPAAASALQLACRQAAAAGVALALDVNWRPTFWDPAADPASGPTPAQISAIVPLLQQAALLKCAAEEARWLFGSDDPAVVCAALPQHPDLVVTDGGAPLRWCFAGRSGELPAFRVPVVDTTGAGDAFTAGLLHGLLHNQPEPLLRFASACGALVCQGAGAIDPQPSADAVCAFLAAN